MPIRTWAFATLLLLLANTGSAADLYQVEMLVFQRWSGSGEEQFNVLDNLAPRARAIENVASLAAGPASRRLNSAAGKLSGKGHRILFHQAWRQTAGGRRSNRWFGIDGPGLTGVVRLTRGRYLHVDTDLTVGGIRTRDHRRMRSGELHHIDHPRVGILVRVDVYSSGAATWHTPRGISPLKAPRS